MKTLLNKIAVITLAFLIFSCSDDTHEINSNLNELRLDLAKFNRIKSSGFNTMNDELGFLKNTDKLINPMDGNLRLSNANIDSILISTTEVSLDNLNDLFESFQNSVDILSLSLLQDENELSDGLILHYLDDEGFLKLKAFQKSDENGGFLELEFPESAVTSFSLNNTLFIARNLFPNRDIVTIGVDQIGEVDPSNSYDDISLLRFMSKYQMPTETIGSQNMRETTIAPKSYLAGEPCAVAVHHCTNGEDGSNCQPFYGGCYPVSEGCGHQSIQAEYHQRQMISELDSYQSLLPTENIYKVKDWLLSQPSGEFYSEAYYTMSKHFSATLDLELLYEITLASPDLSQFVSAISSGNQNYVLSNSSFEKLASVALSSSNKSSSYAYKDFINTLITDAQKYKAKDIKNIEIELSKDIHFQ